MHSSGSDNLLGITDATSMPSVFSIRFWRIMGQIGHIFGWVFHAEKYGFCSRYFPSIRRIANYQGVAVIRYFERMYWSVMGAIAPLRASVVIDNCRTNMRLLLN